jgi:hypothetical protein
MVQTERTIPWGRPYHINVEAGAGALPSPDAVFAELQLQSLDAPVVAADVFNVDPTQFEENPQIAAQFDEAQPTDMRAVTIESTLNVEDVRAALNVGRDQDDMHAIPLTWYEDDLYIVDVKLERQELQEDGSWSEPITVPTLPGQGNLRDILHGETKPPLEELIEQRNEIALDIERPAFFNVRTNQWRRPSEAVAEVAEPEQREEDLSPIGRVESQIRRLYDQIADIERQKENLQEQIDRDQERERDRGGRTRQDNPRIESLKRRIESLDGRIASIEEDIAELEDRALTIDPDWESPFDRSGRLREEEPEEGERSMFGPRGEEEREMSRRDEVPPLLEREEAPLWGHDITVDPGATYRYRISYAVLNPFVDKATRLSESQQHLAESLAVYSEPSAWSEPVQVPAEVYYFVTAASPPQQGTPVARASVRMYQYYEGFWRYAEASLEPGDELEKTLNVSVLPAEPEQGGRAQDVQTSSLTMSIPVTLLDVVERPIKRLSELNTETVEYEAVLADDSGRIVLRRPHLEVADPSLGWLDRMVSQGEAFLEGLEG